MSYLEQSDVYRRNNSIESFEYITAHSTHTQMLLHEILSRHKEANVSTLTLLMLDADPIVLCEVVLAESVSAWRYDLFIAGCWFDFCGARNCVIVFVVRRVALLL